MLNEFYQAVFFLIVVILNSILTVLLGCIFKIKFLEYIYIIHINCINWKIVA